MIARSSIDSNWSSAFSSWSSLSMRATNAFVPPLRKKPLSACVSAWWPRMQRAEDPPVGIRRRRLIRLGPIRRERAEAPRVLREVRAEFRFADRHLHCDRLQDERLQKRRADELFDLVRIRVPERLILRFDGLLAAFLRRSGAFSPAAAVAAAAGFAASGGGVSFLLASSKARWLSSAAAWRSRAAARASKSACWASVFARSAAARSSSRFSFVSAVAFFSASFALPSCCSASDAADLPLRHFRARVLRLRTHRRLRGGCRCSLA